MRPLLLVALLLALALPATAQVAGGLLVSGGEVQFTLSYSVPLYVSPDLELDFDMLQAGDTAAVGLSAPALDLLHLAGLRLAEPAEIWLKALAVGAVVARSDAGLDMGVYWKVSLAELNW